MRLFTAVEVGDEVRSAVAGLLDDLRGRAARTVPDLRVTWTPPERVHLTLCFIGEVDAATVERIRSRLAPPLPLPPFTFTVDSVGTFPAVGPPRVFWAGVGEGRAELLALQQAVRARLAAVPLDLEQRAYTPHLTLGRLKIRAPGVRRALDGLDRRRLGVVAVEAVTLFESRLARETGYVALARTPLRLPAS